MADQHKSLRDTPTWLGRDIADQSHSADLEKLAAVNEFDKGMPREMAEAEAYHQYRVDQHAQAAAHHLTSMKMARASGAHEESDRHALMYEQHVRAMGENPFGGTPTAVKAYENAVQNKQKKTYKGHTWDSAIGSPLGKSKYDAQWDRRDPRSESGWKPPVEPTFSEGDSKYDPKLRTMDDIRLMSEGVPDAPTKPVFDGRNSRYDAEGAQPAPPAPQSTDYFLSLARALLSRKK